MPRSPEDVVRAELVSLELDGNGLAIEFKLEAGGAVRVEQPVTSKEAVRIYRLVSELIRALLEETSGKLFILAPIEANEPGEQYHEPMP